MPRTSPGSSWTITTVKLEGNLRAVFAYRWDGEKLPVVGGTPRGNHSPIARLVPGPQAFRNE
jgi:hypothetical protein